MILRVVHFVVRPVVVKVSEAPVLAGVVLVGPSRVPVLLVLGDALSDLAPAVIALPPGSAPRVDPFVAVHQCSGAGMRRVYLLKSLSYTPMNSPSSLNLK